MNFADHRLLAGMAELQAVSPLTVHWYFGAGLSTGCKDAARFGHYLAEPRRVSTAPSNYCELLFVGVTDI